MTSDRSERAKRIQRMREGRQQRDDEDDAADAAADAADAAADAADAAGDDDPTAEDADPGVDAGVTESASSAADTGTPTADTDDSTEGSASAADTEPAPADVERDAPAVETEKSEPVERSTTAEPDATEFLDDESVEHLDETSVGQVAVGDDAADDAGDADPTAEDADADGEEVDDDSTEEETSVLEFDLGDERYCLDITYIEQIVERGSITRIPNAPDEVEGVIDLRGSITTVIDPKRALDADAEGEGELIIVFDAENIEEEWEVGWTVDDVRRVSHVTQSEVTPSPVEEPWINGIIRREEEDGFVIWTSPDQLMQES